MLRVRSHHDVEEQNRRHVVNLIIVLKVFAFCMDFFVAASIIYNIFYIPPESIAVLKESHKTFTMLLQLVSFPPNIIFFTKRFRPDRITRAFVIKLMRIDIIGSAVFTFFFQIIDSLRRGRSIQQVIQQVVTRDLAVLLLKIVFAFPGAPIGYYLNFQLWKVFWAVFVTIRRKSVIAYLIFSIGWLVVYSQLSLPWKTYVF
mmetsp:Transcript_1612/g.2332  ORF Transcript_1612/g.2332 Transcript_1612/m.2332 type:complete len:201 (-) Transcript_1612:1711-2313(-)